MDSTSALVLPQPQVAHVVTAQQDFGQYKSSIINAYFHLTLWLACLTVDSVESEYVLPL